MLILILCCCDLFIAFLQRLNHRKKLSPGRPVHPSEHVAQRQAQPRGRCAVGEGFGPLGLQPSGAAEWWQRSKWPFKNKNRARYKKKWIFHKKKVEKLNVYDLLSNFLDFGLC